MKIGIVETEHFEVAYAFIRLYEHPENTIVVFTNVFVRRQLEQQLGQGSVKLEWIEQKDPQSKFDFIQLIFRTAKSKKLHQLHLCTINDYHLVYAFFANTLGKSRVILTVHDINSLFRSKHGNNLRSWIRHFGKQALLKSVSTFNVISETMMYELQRLVSKSATIINLPGGVYEGNHSAQDLVQELRLVVPGSIDNNRRNYQEVLRLIEKLEELGQSVEITLLGCPVGRLGNQIVEAAKSFESHYVSVRTYTKFVDPQEYSTKLTRCHLVYLPSAIEYRSEDGIIEVYGKTKSSGNIFDIITHAKPFIAPDKLIIPENLRSSVLRYNTIEDILNLLRKLVSTPGSYQDLQKEAARNSLYYTVESVKEKNSWLFSPEKH